MKKSNNELNTRLKIAKKKAYKKYSNNNNKNTSSLGMALKISTEMIAAVVVVTTIGFIFDNWFGSKPLLIIIFFFIGVSAGILNVFRSAKQMQKN